MSTAKPTQSLLIKITKVQKVKLFSSSVTDEKFACDQNARVVEFQHFIPCMFLVSISYQVAY